jgi:hypothetical protein
MKVYLPVFLTSALDEYEWSALPSRLFTTADRATSAFCVGGLLGRVISFGDVENRQICFPCREANLDFLVVQPAD